MGIIQYLYYKKNCIVGDNFFCYFCIIIAKQLLGLGRTKTGFK